MFESTNNEPSFAYTIGLWKTFSHPEIISFGLSIETLQTILNNAGEKIKTGVILKVLEADYDILENYPIKFLTLDKEQISNYFGYGNSFYQFKEFPVLQLVWPDNKVKFPWEINSDERLNWRQPILNKKFEKYQNQ